MSDYKCPKCGKELTKQEIKNKICEQCGCLFISNKADKQKIKKYSSIITDSRKTNYRFWIRFHIFFLFLWSFLTAFTIVAGFFFASDSWKWVILIIGVVVYAVVFTLIQFQINLIRDVYILKLKVEELKNKEQ